ncbi:hypothetical protein J6590_026394 [Homalodisca vitripennis]|nr:hypothetical protein J6590_073801 [Homalodisca vitripennis]KAG8332224.1 hypothetical protein J6590_026394 [Homalodisca vitripennis]
MEYYYLILFVFSQYDYAVQARTTWCYGEGWHCPVTAPLNLAVCCDPLVCTGRLRFTSTVLGLAKAYMEYKCALPEPQDAAQGLPGVGDNWPMSLATQLLDTLNNISNANLFNQSALPETEENATNFSFVTTPEYNLNFHYP